MLFSGGKWSRIVRIALQGPLVRTCEGGITGGGLWVAYTIIKARDGKCHKLFCGPTTTRKFSLDFLCDGLLRRLRRCDGRDGRPRRRPATAATAATARRVAAVAAVAGRRRGVPSHPLQPSQPSHQSFQRKVGSYGVKNDEKFKKSRMSGNYFLILGGCILGSQRPVMPTLPLGKQVLMTIFFPPSQPPSQWASIEIPFEIFERPQKWCKSVHRTSI